MRKILLLSAMFMMLISCVKNNTGAPDITLPDEGFLYTTTKEVVAAFDAAPKSAEMRYDVLNQNKEVIATSVPNKTALTIGTTDIISVIESLKPGETTAVHFPADGKYATLWFEDLFPAKGDYDMNDIAIGFRYDFVIDNIGLIKTMKINIQPRAIGSSYDKIGLALSINKTQVIIKSINRSNSGNLEAFFEVDAKTIEVGTENSTTQVVIPITGDLRSHFDTRIGGYINVKNDAKYNEPKAFTININFEKALYYDDITLFGTNPNKRFDIDLFAVFSNRSREVHLRGMKPTAKFNQNLFTSNGLTDFATKDNYIWALMIPKPIAHPIEKASIESAYPEFTAWVKSRGASSGNWYETKVGEFCYNRSY